MAGDIEGIGIDLELKTDKVKKGLEQIGGIAEKASKKVETAFRGANQKIGNMGDTARKNVIPALNKLAQSSRKTASVSKKAFGQASKSIDGMRKSTVKARKSTAALNRQLEATKRKAAGAGKATGVIAANLKRFAGIGAVIFVAKKFAKASDSILRFRGTLKALLKDSAEVLPAIEQRMLSMSVKAGVAFDSTAKLFNRIAIIKNDLGASNKEILTFVGNVQKIGVATGASSEGLKFGTVQLAQGLTSGVLRAEELNSILENIPGVAKAIADNMGLSVAQMRQMVLNGGLMSKEVFNALNKESDKYNKNLENMPLTWDRAGARASVAFTAISARIEDSTGISEKLANIWANMFTEVAFSTGALRPIERIKEAIADLDAEIKIVGDRHFNLANIGKLNKLHAAKKALEAEIKTIQEAEKALEKKNETNAAGALISAQEADAAKALMKLKVAEVQISKEISEQNKKAVELGFLAPELALKGVNVDKKRLDIINQIIALEKKLAESKQGKVKGKGFEFDEIVIKPSKGQLSALAEAASLIEDNATAAERLVTFKQRLAELMPDLIALTGSEAKANEVAAAASAKFGKTLEKNAEKQNKMAKAVQRFAEQAASSFADAIVEGESLGKILQSLIKDLTKFFLKRLIFGKLFSSLIPVAGTTRQAAAGGTINGPTLVGERGPEIFNPRGSGSILNNSASKKALGGGSGAPIFNINNNVGAQKDTLAAFAVAFSSFESRINRMFDNNSRGIVF